MKKADFILIAVVVAIAGVLLFFLYGVNSQSGSYVRIEIDGETVETLDLNEDATREIETENGGTNLLVIKDGTLYEYNVFRIVKRGISNCRMYAFT